MVKWSLYWYRYVRYFANLIVVVVVVVVVDFISFYIIYTNARSGPSYSRVIQIAITSPKMSRETANNYCVTTLPCYKFKFQISLNNVFIIFKICIWFTVKTFLCSHSSNWCCFFRFLNWSLLFQYTDNHA